jgi:hypothetical protein
MNRVDEAQAAVKASDWWRLRWRDAHDRRSGWRHRTPLRDRSGMGDWRAVCTSQGRGQRPGIKSVLGAL